MKELFQQIYKALKLCLKSVRVKLEHDYLRNLKHSYRYRNIYFDGPICELPHKIDEPQYFVKAVNKFMASVEGFRDFKTKDIKVLNVFTPDGQTFINTIYAIVRPYGMFYIAINTHNVFFKFNEDIKNKLKATNEFRIYNSYQRDTSSRSSLFYLCKLKKGRVKVYSICQEHIDANGNAEVKCLTYDLGKLPIFYNEMLI